MTVLVVESGESVDTDGTMIPYKAKDLTANAGLMWSNIKTQPEPGIGNSTFNVSVAKVLGGGSVVNGMVYDRGSAADYDAWEALGNEGWGWEGVLPYFKRGKLSRECKTPGDLSEKQCQVPLSNLHLTKLPKASISRGVLKCMVADL